MDKDRLFILQVFCLNAICFMVVFFYKFGGMSMGASDWIPVVVAIISLIGSVCVVSVQLRREGKTIDRIHDCSGTISSTVDRVEGNTKKSADILSDVIKPSLQEVAQRNQKIDALALEMEVHRRLRQSISGNLQDSDTLLAHMQAVFEENARLNIELDESKHQVLLLSAENALLTKEIERYRGRNQPNEEFEMEL